MGDGNDDHAVAQLRDAVGDVFVANLQTLGHDVVVTVVLRSHLNLGVHHLVVLAQGVDKLLVLHLRHARLGDDDGRIVVVGNDDGTGAAALQQLLGVGEHGNQLHRTRSLVDDAAHLRHLTLVAVDGAVGQLQLHGRQLRQTVATLRHRQGVFLGHREVDFHRRVVRHRGQHVLGTHQGTHLEGQRAHNAGGRTLHKAEAQLLLGRSQGGLSLGQAGLGLLILVRGRLQLEVANHLVLKQFLRVLIAQLGGIAGGLRRIDRGLGLAHLSLIGGVVNLEQHLSGTDGLTFLHVDAGNESANLRTNLDVLHTLDRGGIGGLRRSAARTHRYDGELIVTERRATATTAARNEQQCRGRKH